MQYSGATPGDKLRDHITADFLNQLYKLLGSSEFGAKPKPEYKQMHTVTVYNPENRDYMAGDPVWLTLVTATDGDLRLSKQKLDYTVDFSITKQQLAFEVANVEDMDKYAMHDWVLLLEPLAAFGSAEALVSGCAWIQRPAGYNTEDFEDATVWGHENKRKKAQHRYLSYHPTLGSLVRTPLGRAKILHQVGTMLGTTGYLIQMGDVGSEGVFFKFQTLDPGGSGSVDATISTIDDEEVKDPVGALSIHTLYDPLETLSGSPAGTKGWCIWQYGRFYALAQDGSTRWVSFDFDVDDCSLGVTNGNGDREVILSLNDYVKDVRWVSPNLQQRKGCDPDYTNILTGNECDPPVEPPIDPVPP